MTTFADNLRSLPPVDHIVRLELFDAREQPLGTIDNRPGSAGSVAVYHAVMRADGWLDHSASERALALYGEHTAEARAHPGKHPNIDRLLALIDSGQRLRIKIVSR